MPRILVIDDDQSVRRVCGLALRSQGWHAEGEGSARQALARLRSGERFDAVVLDFAMPDLDGIAFLRELAANSIARPPILMASAHADGLTAQRALALGVWDFLSKPLTPNDLRRGVGRLLDRPIAARNGQPRARALLQAVRGDWGAALAALQASSYPEDDLLRGLLLQLQGDVSAANSCFARVGWGLGWKEQGSEIWAELARRLDR